MCNLCDYFVFVFNVFCCFQVFYQAGTELLTLCYVYFAHLVGQCMNRSCDHVIFQGVKGDGRRGDGGSG